MEIRLSLREAAKQLGVMVSMLSRIEHGLEDGGEAILKRIGELRC